MRKHGIDALPREMQQKLDKILAMNLDELNDAYIEKMDRLGLPIVNTNQPTLDMMYRLLIPELFELAAERKRAIVYMTKAADSGRDRPVSGRYGYFLARFFGFALGVNGSGGLFSIRRSKSSVRLFAWPAGRKSSLAISAARSAAFNVFFIIMIGV